MRRALAAIVVALAVTAGCGDEKHATIPPEDLIAAVDQTRAAPSQRIHLEMEMNGLGLDEPVDAKGDGLIDNRTRKGRMTLDMSEFADLAGGSHDPGAGIMEQVIDGFTVYMRWPLFAQQLGTDKEWVKWDFQKLGEQQGLDFGALAGGSQGDPTQQLDQLRATSGDIEVLGNEDVRGVDTTHYKATIDLQRYPGTVGSADRERVRRSVDRLIELTGQKKIPTEVWIGHSTKRVHKTRFKTKVKIPNAPGSFEMDQTMELYDFGVRVPDIQLPPPGDTADIADLGAGAQAP
jgi:hypothetical protein